ncbi:MAG: hypothetical protein IPK97_18185 [Ahniella sp.]|nr:hypothetical protein [Ahniella sp.]
MSTRLAEAAERGYAVDCWPDGSLLRLQIDLSARTNRWGIEQPDGVMGVWTTMQAETTRVEALGSIPAWVLAGDVLVDLATSQRPVVGLDRFGLASKAATRHARTSGLGPYRAKGGLSRGWLETGPAELGPTVTVIEIVDNQPVVGMLPLGPAIDRVQALRSLEERMSSAVACDAQGLPIDTEARTDADETASALECLESLAIQRSEFSGEDEALAKELPLIEVVGVVGDRGSRS